MTSLRFDDFFEHDHEPVRATIDALRASAALGDIHQTSFDFLYPAFASAGFASGGWTQEEGAWDFSDSEVEGSDSSPGWLRMIRYGDDLSRDSRIEVDRVGDGGVRIYFRVDDADNYYYTFVEDSYVGMRKAVEGVEVSLIELPLVIAGDAALRISYYDNRYTTQDDEMFMFATLIVDGRTLCSMRDLIDPDDPPGGAWGVGVYYDGVSSPSLANPLIPDLGAHVDWASLDPGDAPVQTINRIIEGRNIRMLSRWDGTLRIWRPTVHSSDYTIELDDADQLETPSRITDVYTHYRIIGAWDEADAFDYSLMDQYRYKFGMSQNPFLLSQSECVREAARAIQSSVENALRNRLATPFQPLLEKEDVITYDGTDWIVDSVHVSGEKPRMASQIELRKYVYGA